MTYRVRHKSEGWTGTLTLEDAYLSTRSESSHHQFFRIEIEGHLMQDSIGPDGRYHEDPSIGSLDELEVIETTPGSDEAHKKALDLNIL